MAISNETRELTPADAGYPAALRALATPPERLWLRGRLPSVEQRAVAVVGSRAATREALAMAHQLGRALAARGVTVVSGGALGVDGAAHQGALDGGGATVAVLGTGVDVVYPVAHRALFAAMQHNGGALLTPYPPGSQPLPWHFPARNPLVAALGELCVVVAAGSSSGALYTATAARRLGRRVVAIVGTPGCDSLVADGATGARDLDDVLAVVDGGRPAEPPAPDDARSAQLYAALDDVPRELGEVAVRAGLAVADALAHAIDLEVAGLAVRAPGGRYLRAVTR